MRIALAVGMLAIASCAVPATKRNQVVDPTAPDDSAELAHRLRYLIYLPEEYADPASAERSWPLILFLHGIGESGDRIGLVARYGPPAEVEKGRELPFVIVSPQNPKFGKRWNPAELIAVLDEVVARYRIDEHRIYLTGTSMGGLATWSTAIAHPERFAALAPVCAFGDPSEVERIAHIPVWAFHGGKDFIVSPRAGKEMVDAHRAAGGNARWTLEPEAGHAVWDVVYPRDDLYEWLLEHRRRDAVPTPAHRLRGSKAGTG